ncbi:MAG: S26 family signal peptidase [Pseudomonadota bacterium]
MSQRLIIASLSLAVTALGVALTVSLPSCVIYNPSVSAPQGWYALASADRLQVGEHVLVRLPSATAELAAQRRYLPMNIPLLKRIAATAPQQVCVRAGRVLIDGRLTAVQRAADTQGRLLPQWQDCRRLRAGELFLLSETSDASFDSRYFGPITVDRVIGRARALWTWAQPRGEP